MLTSLPFHYADSTALCRFASTCVPPSLSLLLIESITANNAFRVGGKLRGLCPWSKTSEHISCCFFNRIILTYVLIPRFRNWGWKRKLKSAYVSNIWSLAFFTQAQMHDFGGVFHNNELGSFFGHGSNWHECLMTEMVKGLFFTFSFGWYRDT